MATASTLPGTLNLSVKHGDELSQLCDFSIDLTGYTFDAEVVSAITYAEVASITVTAVDLEEGQPPVVGGQCAVVARGEFQL